MVHMDNGMHNTWQVYVICLNGKCRHRGYHILILMQSNYSIECHVFRNHLRYKLRYLFLGNIYDYNVLGGYCLSMATFSTIKTAAIMLPLKYNHKVSSVGLLNNCLQLREFHKTPPIRKRD